MSFETTPRFRIRATEGANGWRFEGTAEYKSDKINRSDDPEDPADIVEEPLGARLYSMIYETREHFKEMGEPLASEYIPPPKNKPLPSTSAIIREKVDASHLRKKKK